MEELFRISLSEFLQGDGPVSRVLFFGTTALWASAFLLLGFLLGRKAFRMGRDAVLQLEAENTADMVRLEQYRVQIEQQQRSPVLRRTPDAS